MALESSYFYTLNSVLMICSFVLFVEYFIVLKMQGNRSMNAGTRTKEDLKYAKVNQIDGTSPEKSMEIEKRWKGIVSNHMETIPFSYLVFFIATYVSTNTRSRLGLIVLIVVYTFLRISHTFVYAYSIQPFRSLFWLFANLCVITAGIIGVVDTFQTLDNIGVDNNP